MADIQKFLNQAGVSTLWSRIAEEVGKVDNKVAGHETRLSAAESKIEALEKGTYDDTEVRGLISDNADAIATNKAAHEANAAAIEKLNGDAEVAGSVANTATTIAAAKVAEIVANADADFDTLKEIADWILNDTTGAADMANDIAELQRLVGSEEVATQIAGAIEAALKVDGVDKYALASDLSGLSDRVKALEDMDYITYLETENLVDGKIAALKLAETYEKAGAAATAESNAKAYADGLNSAMDVRVLALEAIDHTKYESAGAAAQALVDAKAYTDTEMAKIQALSEAEIDAAIAAAKAQA